MNEEQYDSVVLQHAPAGMHIGCNPEGVDLFVLPLIMSVVYRSGVRTACKDAVAQNDGELFGLPVVMDTRDDSVAVGDKVLLTYQVRWGSYPGNSQHASLAAGQRSCCCQQTLVQRVRRYSVIPGFICRRHAQHNLLCTRA